MDGSNRSRPASRAFDDIPRASQRRRMQEDQGAYSDDSSSQFGTPLQNPSMGYQSDYSPQTAHRPPQQSFPPYAMYNLPQSPPVSSQSYGSIQAYPAHRQSTAIEVLSSQFGVPGYYVPESQTSGSNVGTPQQQSSQSQYYGQSSPPGRIQHAYTSSIHDLTQQQQHPQPQQQSSAIEPPTEEPEFGQQGQSAALEEAYTRYQTALRGTFQNMRDGRLIEAGSSLLVLSDWLLSNAVDLVSGLVRDEQELYSDRTRLWNEFNICWLSVLSKQKELTQDIMSGHQLQAPKGILREETLQRMGTELIRLCDSMERHGLVDYQMGVWEEEILDSIQECLDLLERHYGPPPTAGSRNP